VQVELAKWLAKYIKNSNCRLWSYAKIIFPFDLAGMEVLSKDPTVWLDGACPHPKVLANNFQLKNENFACNDKKSKNWQSHCPYK
jgi:hypothetical protein